MRRMFSEKQIEKLASEVAKDTFSKEIIKITSGDVINLTPDSANYQIPEELINGQVYKFNLYNNSDTKFFSNQITSTTDTGVSGISGADYEERYIEIPSITLYLFLFGCLIKVEADL